MEDHILSARLAALEQHLLDVNPTAENSPQVRPDFKLAVTPDDEVWYYLATGITRKVVQQLGTVRDIRERLGRVTGAADLAEEWANYSHAYEESQEIFHECLELLGGLTFRERVEEQLSMPIFRYADALIRDYALRTDHGKSLSVPAAREALKRTLGRIVRLRYPEWTVWSLPLTAHEYGHVLEERPEDLLALARRKAPEWVERFVAEEVENRPNWTREEVVIAAERRATAHLQVYWADAFATYVSGPAYPWAFIFLRFNPATVPGTTDLPRDEGRLLVSLAILRRLNDMAPKPYARILRDVEEKEQRILERLRAANPLSREERAVLGVLADALGQKLIDDFPYAYYPPSGWDIAQEWDFRWRNHFKHTSATPPIMEKDVSGLVTLRDVLNAAWLCRVTVPDKADQVAEAAKELCKLVLGREPPPPPSNAFSSRPQSPPGRV